MKPRSFRSGPMKPRSITRCLIAAVLLVELVAALALIAIAAFHESRIRFRTLDATLQSQAATLLGAVGEADDPANVKLDIRGIAVPRHDLYRVTDETGRVLGQSAHWPSVAVQPSSSAVVENEPFRIRLDGRPYRFLQMQGTRVIDPGDSNGGVVHHITLLYGSPTGAVWHEVREAVRFYALASLLLLLMTGLTMAWFLRRGLAPLHELAEEAGRVSAQQWQFTAPESARTTRELAPLAHAIEAALLRLQQTFQQQRRFTSDAAHELKTDVAIVKSSLQLLAMRPRSVEEYQQGIDQSLQDCERLEATVQEMLTLAALQHQVPQATPSLSSPVTSDLTTFAEEAVRRFKPLAELRGVLVVLVAPNPALAPLESKEATLLCTNLLLNAIQHSRAGSPVQIDIAACDAHVAFAIEDYGEGIAPEVLPHVFEPFFRGDASRDRKSGGTGLGLTICKAICDRAGGTIKIQSTQGTGTRVVVELPKTLAR